MQILDIDLSERSVAQILNAKQGDVGRKFRAVITDAGTAYAVPSDVRFSVWYSGPGGEGNYSAVGTRDAVTVQGNTVTVELIGQMLVNAGTGALCMVMNAADGTQLGLWNIAYTVEPVPGAGSEKAEQYYTALSEAAANALKAAQTFETDPTITMPGKAADAAAVGNALACKAGFVSALWENLDDLTVSGWYWFETGGGIDGMMFTHSHMRVDALDGRNLRQTLYPVTADNLVLRRQRYNGTWGAWEWENPPMRPGVEYRTTQRYNGKVVFAKLIDCGSLPNATHKTVALDTTIGELVDLAVSAIWSDGSWRYTMPFYGTSGKLYCFACIVENSKLRLYAVDYDASEYTGKALIRYTKT